MHFQIIDKVDVKDPTNREGLWADKLDTFIPRGTNMRPFLF